MRKFSLSYSISQSFKGLWRNGVMSAASILVLMACLIVMGSFSLLVYNIDVNLDRFGALNEITVYCDASCTPEQVAEIERQIRSLDNVNTDTLIHNTKEDVLELARERYSSANYSDFFDEMEQRGENPFREQFIITYTNTRTVETLIYQLNNIEGVANVSSVADLAKTMDNFKGGIIFVFVLFLVILFVVSLFVIINTIKLAVYARKSEIAIMRYVGATKGFITLPFVFEGALIGLIASGIAYLVQWYSYSYVSKLIAKDYELIQVVPFSSVDGRVALGFVAVGVFAGVVGCVISLSKYLKA